MKKCHKGLDSPFFCAYNKQVINRDPHSMNIQKLVEMRDEDFREYIAECEKQAAELGVNLDYFMEEWICD